MASQRNVRERKARFVPPGPPGSRYAETVRRYRLGSRAALGLLAVLPGLACGHDDAAVFDAATTTDTTDSSDDPAATELGADPSTTLGSTTLDTEAPSDGGGDGRTDEVFPAGGELLVSFSFNPVSSGDRIRNPYVAVWVEETDGDLVDTVSLWYEQSGNGSRWLKDLRVWYEVTGGDATRVSSGATRIAGDYTVAWDGTDLEGQLVPAGDYVLRVEAAREHGPYEITSTTFTVGADGGQWVLDDVDELTGLSVELTV